MSLFEKLLPDGVDLKEIDRRAAEAEKRSISQNATHEGIYQELKKLNATLEVFKYAVEVWVKKNA